MKPGSNVVDLGTGKGRFVRELREEKGVNARGVDLWLSRQQQNSGNFTLAPAHRTGLPSGGSDVVTINRVLHYSVDDDYAGEVIAEAKRINKPRGSILISPVTGDEGKRYRTIAKRLSLEVVPDPNAEKNNYIQFRRRTTKV